MPGRGFIAQPVHRNALLVPRSGRTSGRERDIEVTGLCHDGPAECFPSSMVEDARSPLQSRSPSPRTGGRDPAGTLSPTLSIRADGTCAYGDFCDYVGTKVRDNCVILVAIGHPCRASAAQTREIATSWRYRHRSVEIVSCSPGSNYRESVSIMDRTCLRRSVRLPGFLPEPRSKK
jgi:hypothetical protein